MADSLRELYERYGYLVFRRCHALLRHRADAEDAMQEVFMRADRYGRRHEGSTLSWLYTIATHVCFDAARRRGRAEPTAPSHLTLVDARSEGTADDGDVRALVGRALRELDPVTCEMGVLHHLGGFTQEEVAERTGYSRKTVGRKLEAFDAVLRQRTEVLS